MNCLSDFTPGDFLTAADDQIIIRFRNIRADIHGSVKIFFHLLSLLFRLIKSGFSGKLRRNLHSQQHGMIETFTGFYGNHFGVTHRFSASIQCHALVTLLRHRQKFIRQRNCCKALFVILVHQEDSLTRTVRHAHAAAGTFCSGMFLLYHIF